MPATQMPSTRLPAHIFYAIEADKRERDPVMDPASASRATVPYGRGFALWQRMNAGAQLVWIDDMEGNPRAITPKQAQVLALALEMVEGDMLTMRGMAARLGFAPSTVSRALTKLSAWGILCYIVGRGRFAGLVIIKRTVGDGQDRFREAAKARVRRWSEAVKRRISRLEINVAPYLLERWRGTEVDTLTQYLVHIDKGATLTAQLNQEWRSEELVDIV